MHNFRSFLSKFIRILVYDLFFFLGGGLQGEGPPYENFHLVS